MIKRQDNNKFELVSPYKPAGDQQQAIDQLTAGFQAGDKEQILKGATGTGKTYTMANVIAKMNKPTLVITHNKTLVGQLYNEFKEFFPNNAVEYFVSYYDYYQPEAYVPQSDTYIEKDASINDEIDQLRHAATSALMSRNDVIVVASVSCIYGLGDPREYAASVLNVYTGQEYERNTLLRDLVNIQYDRNDIDFQRGRFRVRGDVVEVFPAGYSDRAYRIEFFGDEIDRIVEVDPLTGEVHGVRDSISLFPATHFMTNDDQLTGAIDRIKAEMDDQVKKFEKEGKLLEAERIKQRTTYDLEMLREVGYTNGIENYSRQMENRKAGEPPYTLLDFFPKDSLILIDESHATMPEIRAMYNGDRNRKQTLIDYGFRLPSALDNRPLKLEEFEQHVNQIMYVSATPGDYELNQTSRIVEQVIRPTGLLDPKVEVRPIEGQIDDLVAEINLRIERKERVFVTTLTKKMAEDLTDYLKDLGIKVRYLHSDIKTLERMQIIRDLRLGKFDVLIGINLLREGIDVPEVSLVAILDADKEGFLRAYRPLIQTMGRAARNANGEVIMYADRITDSMKLAIDETNRRRAIQMKYNEEHGIVPKTIIKPVRDMISVVKADKEAEKSDSFADLNLDELTAKQKKQMIANLKEQMQDAAKRLDFESAANLRDAIIELEGSVRKPIKKKGKDFNGR
ncbi:excinuclease ABC subunit B [Lactobacillus delbrueckii subsp. delbrueckii DSM 20074 = JCM 1012]|uniref:excinuclease ABC subunit UvrB n=1 Tax=Lactobacillus delbrueckii TaxID=1584 RepID=UPI00069C3555|nr:excinuclease ABC subunit UvrB [Lactobacillus delbrueckii]APP09410.1 excinuclease ABC subunit B [Lactobacillus delbrueckii subsp. delbrueckii DSM 20074 = JCM 1012]KNZ38426.1 excinuclease ABC subunit B [Lactobacillus delbrueckii subsp. delbrueckii]KRK27401.1 excinuclease ABC subunit B [Lactobacillus delbrueckii subsp. delbrueckii DSM 20074 = JCM 1012]MCT3493047.1 excinuclease ABC subunit UvrB [Lactobacillus delbrueckii]MCT3521188.1 excinuclease ABC subunit UvrB [Lactobacillus delbrueckii]